MLRAPRAVSGAISTLDARTAIQVPADDADAALYNDRDHLASAKKATEIWAARLAANPRDFDSAYKLAQARYWLGTNGLPEPERKAALESGIAAARIGHRPERQSSRRPFLAGRQHGRARRIVRPAPGHQVSRADQGRDARRRSNSIRHSSRLRRSRARPLVLQGAGIVRRQQQAVGSALAQVADLQSEQRHLASSSSPRRSRTWAAKRKRAKNARRRLMRRSIPIGRRKIKRFKETAKRLLRDLQR